MTAYSYYMSQDSKTYTQAQDDCRLFGGEIASIFSRDEELHILSLYASSEYWIGYKMAKSEKSFAWSNGAFSSYNNFRNGEGRKFGCAVMTKNGWISKPCGTTMKYICKFTS